MVLEHYRNDPRYMYRTSDVKGLISVSDDFFESEKMAESDQVLLSTFGRCYRDREVAVAVFLRYLADLSPEHQQIWKARELSGEWLLHYEYMRSEVYGMFHEGWSINDAFLEEMRIINQMSAAIGRPPLFRNEYSGENRPREFGFLIRPTLRELNGFVHILDKMISENINREFFMGEIEFEEEIERRDGRIQVRPKGTIRCLEEWVFQTIRFPDPGPANDMVAAFKEVRKRRQQPAHALNEDRFDQALISEQQELMNRVYDAMRTMRLILANHPATKDIKIDPALYEGRIYTR